MRILSIPRMLCRRISPSGAALYLAAFVSACAFDITPAKAGDLDNLIQSCAPLVHPQTMGKLVRVESGGHLFAVSDDGPANRPWAERKHMLHSFYPQSMAEALGIAKQLRSEGHLFGVGPAQVSSRNFSLYGVTLEQALDPCTNLAIGSKILTNYYLDAQQTWTNPAEAVLAAISAYNTGNFVDGFSNGYVRKVMAAGSVPALSDAYDSRLPQNPISDGSSQGSHESIPPYQVRLVRPPDLLSSKITVLHVDMENQ